MWLPESLRANASVPLWVGTECEVQSDTVEFTSRVRVRGVASRQRGLLSLLGRVNVIVVLTHAEFQLTAEPGKWSVCLSKKGTERAPT